LVPLTLNLHLEFMTDGERDIFNATELMRTGDLSIPGAYLGQSGAWVGADIDQGPLHSFLIAPALAINASPTAVIATHGLATVLGLLVFFFFARRYVHDAGALLAVLLLAASGQTLTAVEHVWHPAMVPGLALIQLALLDRLLHKPTTATLTGLLVVTAIVCQVYMAAASTVPAVLVALGWIVFKKQLPRKRVLMAVAAGFIASLPFLLRFFWAEHEAVEGGASESADLPWGRFAAAIGRLLDPGWTALSGWLPVAWIVGVGALLGLVGLFRHRGMALAVWLVLLGGVLTLAARAYALQESQRYLLLVPGVLFCLAVRGFGELPVWKREPKDRPWIQTLIAGFAMGVLWIPPAIGGWNMTSLSPTPTYPSERIGADTRLGLGEQQTVADWLKEQRNWAWDDWVQCTHGTLLTFEHGMAWLSGLENTPASCTDGPHVLIAPKATSIHAAPERVVGRHGFDGAYGRRIQMVLFQPAVDLTQAQASLVDKEGKRTPCTLPLPTRAHPTRHSWPNHGAPDRAPTAQDTCSGREPGAQIRVTIPVVTPEGTVQVLLRPVTDPKFLPHPSAVRLLGGQDEPYAIFSVAWAPPTQELVLLLPADEKLVLLDVY